MLPSSKLVSVDAPGVQFTFSQQYYSQTQKTVNVVINLLLQFLAVNSCCFISHLIIGPNTINIPEIISSQVP